MILDCFVSRQPWVWATASFGAPPGAFFAGPVLSLRTRGLEQAEHLITILVYSASVKIHERQLRTTVRVVSFAGFPEQKRCMAQISPNPEPFTVLERKVGASMDIARVTGLLVELGGPHDSGCGVVDVEELARGRAGAPSPSRCAPSRRRARSVLATSPSDPRSAPHPREGPRCARRSLDRRSRSSPSPASS